MVQYLRRLDDIPAFSELPIPGHAATKVVDKILIDPVTGSKGFMLLWAKFEPGTETEVHTHPVEQSYFVLSGSLQVTVAGQQFVAAPNSAVLLPAGEQHAVVAGAEEGATFLIVFSPPLESFAAKPH